MGQNPNPPDGAWCPHCHHKMPVALRARCGQCRVVARMLEPNTTAQKLAELHAPGNELALAAFLVRAIP
jgi:hypothetical protein